MTKRGAGLTGDDNTSFDGREIFVVEKILPDPVGIFSFKNICLVFL